MVQHVLENVLQMPHTGGVIQGRRYSTSHDAESTKVTQPLISRAEYTTCHRIVRHYLNMRPYHIQRMHALTQLNCEGRLNFVTMMCERHRGEQRIHMSHTNSKEPALNKMFGAEWPLRKSTDHSFLRRGLFVPSIILTRSSSKWSLNYSKMGYWTPLSINSTALHRIGLS